MFRKCNAESGVKSAENIDIGRSRVDVYRRRSPARRPTTTIRNFIARPRAYAVDSFPVSFQCLRPRDKVVVWKTFASSSGIETINKRRRPEDGWTTRINRFAFVNDNTQSSGGGGETKWKFVVARLVCLVKNRHCQQGFSEKNRSGTDRSASGAALPVRSRFDERTIFQTLFPSPETTEN